MTSLRKLLSWLTLVLIGGVVLLIPVSYGWLQSTWGKSWVASRIQESYNGQLKSTLHIGSIEGRLPVRFNLNDVAITLKDDSGHTDTIAQVTRIEVSLRFWDFLYGQLQMNALSMIDPVIYVDILPDSSLGIVRAFEAQTPRETPSEVFLPVDLDVYAPQVSIRNGTIYMGDGVAGLRKGDMVIPSTIDSIEARFFIELNKQQRFADVVALSARTSDSWIDEISLKGQLFSDSRFTEIRRLNIQTRNSSVNADFILDGSDINKKGWSNQLDSARITFNIDETQLHPDDFRPWIRDYPNFNQAVDLEFDGSGTLSDFSINYIELLHGETSLKASGELNNAFNGNLLAYNGDITEAKVSFGDLAVFVPNIDTSLTRVMSEATIRGLITGNLDSLETDFFIATPAGELSVGGGVNWRGPISYRAAISAIGLDLDSWNAANMPRTLLNASAFVEGNGFDTSANVALTSTVIGSRIRGVEIDTLRMIAGLNDSELMARINLVSEAGSLDANGNFILFASNPEYHLDGSVKNLDLSAFRSDTLLPVTSLNTDFSLDVFGADIDGLYGRISVDGSESVVGDQTYPAVQVYADLSEPAGNMRTFRLTSSFLDAVITGNLIPNNIRRQFDYWISEVDRQVKEEFFKADDLNIERSVPTPSEAVSLEYDISIKQIQTLKRLVTTMPDIHTNARIEGTVVADADRMLLNLAVVDDSMRVDNIGANNLDVRLTMALQHGQDLGSSANLQMASSLGSLQIGRFDMDNIQTRATLLNDSLFVSQTIANIGDGARSSYTIQAAIKDTTIAVEFPTFFLGNNQYSWRASETPKLTLLPGGKIDFTDFRFENANQSVMLQGVFSEDTADMLVLNLVDVDLKSISELVKVRFNFEGIVNGLLQTRSLRSQTNIEGHVTVDAFAINERVVGDVQLDSEYNPVLRRFDTIISVKTDSVKYAEYFDTNIGIGQDIELVGYIAPRNLNDDLDHLFNFDVSLNEVDLWVIRYLLLDVFTKVEGKATGFGNIRGGAGELTYDANFTVENAQVIPVFLSTNYVLNGDIAFNDNDGLVFNDVRVNDDKRGTGVLSGNVDMNDFQPEKFLDLRLRLNRLEFLNNSYDPDFPFYGRVTGSGDIRLFGPTTKMFLQTARPITVTPNSKLIIPLLDETAINQQTNFIRFVNQFFERNINLAGTPTPGTPTTTAQGRNFYDIFQLDLQFNMPQDAAIEFIFDPVTNEYLTTRGTGSVRITLENANLGMFGTFDIDRGEYNFVGGDIFSKKFKIRQGGQVIWDGVAQDPIIDVSAYFSSRPNLSPLGTGRDVRAPIDLILNLNGRIGSLENDFFFAYPTTNFDQGLTASELNILNGEDQKLLQATSLLITGNFLPVNTGGQTDVNLQNKMTQAGIGQLLSSQINYLLNSSLSNFDFDLNLTGFDQADLGIGLRLFDDRLELRRDGTIVGDQTNIGDLAATYRINRFFSVEIFHRQDINSTRGLSQEGTVDRVNGVGLQYQVEFSSWKKFLSDIWRALTGSDS